MILIKLANDLQRVRPGPGLEPRRRQGLLPNDLNQLGRAQRHFVMTEVKNSTQLPIERASQFVRWIRIDGLTITAADDRHHFFTVIGCFIFDENFLLK